MSRGVFFRTPYNYDTDEVSAETGLACSDETLTQQQFKEESDINEIVRRFGLTGQMPENVNLPRYGDFTEVTDFQSALNLVLQAEDEFMRLPAELRARFQNDPGALLDFVHDDRNRDEAIKLGLIEKGVEKARDGTELPPDVKPADGA